MLIAVFQYFTGIVTIFLLKAFARFDIHGKENISNLSKPFILTPNHESFLDPQLAGLVFMGKPSLFPLRYMAKDLLFLIPGLNILIWALGAFRAHKGKGIGKSLQTPTKILKRGGNVIMFPEGKRIMERPHLGEGRRGAAILALTTNAIIVPMSVHTPHGLTPYTFILKKPKISIRIGEPFYLNQSEFPDLGEETTMKATQVIMKKISELYYKHEY